MVMSSESKSGRERTMTGRENWKTTKKERLFYSMGFSSGVGESFMLQLNLTTYLLMLGIPLSVSALVLMIMKVIDAADDVLFGWLIDRIHPGRNQRLKKYLGSGKYIPWLRMLFFVMPLAVILLYHIPESWSVTGKCIWFCVFYLLAELGYTILDVPMQSLLMTMTDEASERDSMISQRTILQYVLAVVLSYGNTLCLSRYVGLSIGTTTLLFCSVLLFSMIPMLFGVREHMILDRAGVNTDHAEEDAQKREESEAMPLWESLKTLFLNRNLIVNYSGQIIAGCLATGSAAGIFGAYYLWGNELVSFITTLPAVIILLLTLVIARKLVEKYDKHRFRMVMLPVSMVIDALIFFTGHNNLALYITLVILSMIPAGLAAGSSQYLTPECIEYGKFKTGKDSTGIQFAFVSFAAKLPNAIAGSLGLWVLDLFGWQTISAESFAEVVELGIQQSPRAIEGLWFITSGMPVIGSVLAYLCYLFYNLTSKDAAIMAKCNNGEISREEAEALLSKQY